MTSLFNIKRKQSLSDEPMKWSVSFFSYQLDLQYETNTKGKAQEPFLLQKMRSLSSTSTYLFTVFQWLIDHRK